MTSDGFRAVLKIWGLRYMRPSESGATLWLGRTGVVHWVPDVTSLSPDERRDFIHQMAERLGEAVPAEAAA